MPGKPFSGEAETILRGEAGRRSAEEIAQMTGHSEKTIRRHMARLNLEPYHPARRNMTRRDKLLLGAAGLSYATEPDIC